MKKEFTDYELCLLMYNDAFGRGGEAHANHEVGKCVKPEGYDEYKAEQTKLLLGNEIKNEKKNEKKKKIIQNYEVKGYEFDKDGIPRYLTADDVYNGVQNPEWLKKHEKIEEMTKKIPIQKSQETQKLGINYDADGIPEYLNAECYHFGEANPEWLKKHEPHNYKP